MKKLYPVVFALMVTDTTAYEVSSHDAFTRKAVKNSVLNTTTYLEKLGLSSSDTFSYSDGTASGRTVEDIVVFGVRTEDSGKRPLNHFYDPQVANSDNRGARILGINLAQPSVDWVMEESSNECQTYSYKDARAKQKLMLTSSTKDLRKSAAGWFFESIGHTLHHIQDMGQPQHVRGDIHWNGDGASYRDWFTKCTSLTEGEITDIEHIIGPLLGQPSAYEAYSARSDVIDYVTSLPLYPSAVGFSEPREFWDNSSDSGMADFTSSNFISSDTNFRQGFSGRLTNDSTHINPAAPSVSLDEGPVDISTLQLKSNWKIDHLDGEITFIRKNITDPYTGSTHNNVRISAYSVFEDELKKHVEKSGGKANISRSVYSVNPFIYEARHEILVPRLIGFSSGMINHFFRGEIIFENSKIFNRSSETMNGTYSIYTDDSSGTRTKLMGPNPLNLASGTSLSNSAFVFDRSYKDKKAILIFEGTLGKEQGAVASHAFTITESMIKQVACSGSVSISGDSNKPSPNPTVMTLGTTDSRDFELSFATYMIPDEIEITDAVTGARIFKKDGSGVINKSIDPASATNDDRKINIYIDPNNLEATQWKLRVGCPGSGVNEYEEGRDMKDALFSFTKSGTKTCAFDFYVDGKKVGRNGGTADKKVENLFIGSHSYGYKNVDCTDGTGNFGASVIVGGTTTSLYGVQNGLTESFEVK